MSEKLRSLAINFGDNDFHSACSCLLKMLKVAHEHSDNFQNLTDKTKLCFIINQMLFGAYVSCQNVFEYNGLENMDADYISHMKEYLTVEPKNILINDEADFKIMHRNNGEVFYIEFQFGQVWVA